MKISTILFISFSFYTQLVLGQSEIWTDQAHLKEVIEFEQNLHNNFEVIDKTVFISESTFPNVDKYDIASPLIILRPSKNDLPIYAEYFFSSPDSTLRFISYNWELDRYGNYKDKQNIWDSESKKLNQYNSKYEVIKSYLVEKLGEPTEQDSKPQETKSNRDNSTYWSRNTSWNNGHVVSTLSLVFASNTYRIRWNYYWNE